MENPPRVHPVGPSYGPPKYVMLNGSGTIRPPPFRRNVPRYHSYGHKKRGGCGCLRCICCCYCFLIVLVLVLISIFALLYHSYSPKPPTYSVQKMNIGSFDVKPDFSLHAEIVVTIKAVNPNHQISLIYGEGSSIVVLYSDTKLCSGKLPAFHQGSHNTTMVDVSLKGTTTYGSKLEEAITGNKLKGHIPLLIMVKVPVSVVLGDVPLRQFNVLVNCSLVVNKLAPNEKVEIISSKYNVAIELEGYALHF